MKSRQNARSGSAASRSARARRRCAAIVAALSAYVDGEVDAQLEARIEAHLPRCPKCSRALCTLVVVADAVDRARLRVADPGIDERFRRFTAIVRRTGWERTPAARRDAAPAKSTVKRARTPAHRSGRTPHGRRRARPST